MNPRKTDFELVGDTKTDYVFRSHKEKKLIRRPKCISLFENPIYLILYIESLSGAEEYDRVATIVYGNAENIGKHASTKEKNEIYQALLAGCSTFGVSCLDLLRVIWLGGEGVDV
jgi:hypothetical protein